MDEVIGAGQAAAMWAGLSLLLLFVLSLLVVRQRVKHKVVIGDGDVPELVKATRAFGNATEYVPALLAGLAILAVAGAPASAIHVVGALMFLGRLGHAVGMTLTSGTSIGRAAGTVMTWLALLIGGVMLVFYGLG